MLVKHFVCITNNYEFRELQAILPIKFPLGSTDWSSPHIKTHLLYQAHFSQTHLPVDYRTDQRSILESCIRIVQV